MKLTSVLFLLFCVVMSVFSQNPISPPGIYIADPSAHVWNDGKIYVYGSLDEECSYYCSKRHHVMVSEDMLHWDVEENVFHSEGEKDEVSGSDALLFAPDCMEKDGTYYMYYCMPDKNHAEGVATSQSPTGPFVNGERIELGGFNEIDPSCFIDDDGQAYYVWGQFTLKMAKMKPNMKELDLSTVKDKVLTEEEHFFHEGAFLTKRNGIYYLVYADMSRANMPTCIGYATSKNPFGPYKYGGVIVDNRQCNPNNWNNHGSIAEFENQWYVFYHRSTHACNKMRKACVEPITFNEDGSIPEVGMTSQGAAPSLSAFEKIDAERACLLMGDVFIKQFEVENELLTNSKNGDKAAYKYIDFKNGVKKVIIRIKPGKDGGTISMKLDQSWHKTLATINIEPSTNGEWQTFTFNTENKVSGVHALWLQFQGDGEDMFEIDWIEFK